MKDITIDELAYLIKEAKKSGQPQPIFFLGAGASKSGDVPLASEIVEDILKKYSDSPFVQKLKEDDRVYSKLMECLQPHQRNELLKGYINEAKINVTHIYLAQLLKQDFVDYVLTVNFDNLMLRALSLYNEFPPTYDMAILKDLTTTKFKEKSVVYLHGQHHGLWLLNTPEEMKKVGDTVPRIFDSIKDRRPWVFIGYSGSDPIFEHIKKLGRFDNGLYWVGYNDHPPDKQVQDFLNTPNTNAFQIKGYDSDAFMLKLNEELGLGQPKILGRPFSALSDTLNEIKDIDDKEHFEGVKERLEIARGNTAVAIEQFENGNADAVSKEELDIQALKMQLVSTLIGEQYDEREMGKFEEKAIQIKDEGVNEMVSKLFNNWGNSLGSLAEVKSGEEAIELFSQAFEKLQKAVEFKPNQPTAFYNWGTYLGGLASIQSGEQAEALYEQSFEKFQRSIEFNPDEYQAYANWGTFLSRLAMIKGGSEAEILYNQSFEKFQKSIEIEPDQRLVYRNWGSSIDNVAKSKTGREAGVLYCQAIEKYQKAVELKADDYEAYNNWGYSLLQMSKNSEDEKAQEYIDEAIIVTSKGVEFGGISYNKACAYALKKDKANALKTLDTSLSKKETTVEFVLEDDDWKDYLEGNDFKALIEQHRKGDPE